MSSEISFCPVCAGKLDAGRQDQYSCEECEMQFLIEVVDVDADDVEDDEDDEEEEDEEDADDE
jgi:hypothetical protein